MRLSCSPALSLIRRPVNNVNWLHLTLSYMIENICFNYILMKYFHYLKGETFQGLSRVNYEESGFILVDGCVHYRVSFALVCVCVFLSPAF